MAAAPAAPAEPPPWEEFAPHDAEVATMEASTPMPAADPAPITAVAPVVQPGPVAPVAVLAVPVWTSPEPSERLQPRPDSRASAPAVAGFRDTEEGAFWHATVQQLIEDGAIIALVRELALQSQLVARDGGHWLLRVERESLNQPSARERLRAALEAAGLASQIGVEVGVVSDSPARRNAAMAAERLRQAEEIVQNDAFVRSMVHDFGAKIVPGSIQPL